jgi:hypothetical protein
MSHGRVFSYFLLAALVSLPAGAQSVISTHSGLIHFFEGAVYLGEHPLESHLGRFPSVPQGGELRTAGGRAEVLLTPGVFLRLGENSAIRLVSNELSDTKVELEKGAAIVESGGPTPDASVALTYKDWKIHFLEKGIYRIETDPARLLVTEGRADVAAAAGPAVVVAQGMSVPLEKVLAPEPSNELLTDSLSSWSDGRDQSISADNAILAQIDEDPASRNAAPDSFTYFPMLGALPSYGMSTPGLYGSSMSPYQPGFNSLYLPGYVYAPVIVGLIGRGTPGLGLAGQRGVRTYVPLTPLPRIGGLPGSGGAVFTAPRAPIGAVGVGVRPAPVRIAPPAAARPVGHR